jgi:hypothetical protein
MTYEFNICSKKFIINDERHEETQRTFKQNEAERDDLADRCATLEKKLVETKTLLESRCDEKNQRMHDKVDMIERNLTM